MVTSLLPRPGEPGKSIQEFYEDKHFVRVLLGARGSGKTSALADDICRHLWHSAGGRAIIARKTETSNADSTIGTFKQFFSSHPNIYGPATCGLFREWNNGLKFRIPSRLAIERMQRDREKLTSPREILNWVELIGAPLCGIIEMRGLPNITAGDSKLRGMECSYFAMVEADQIERRYFDLSLACLRWKGADPETCDDKGFIKDRSVVLDTNPPGTKHWIAQMEEEENAKPENDRRMRFWHIATDENAHNLPENYIRDQIMLPYAKNPAMIERMRYGRYKDAFEGSPVFYNYDQTLHVGHNLPWVKGAYLVRGWDFGTCNAVTWLMYWENKGMEYLHALSEQYLEGSDTDRQASMAVTATEAEFPFWNDRSECSGLMDFCDPAGANSNFGVGHNMKGERIGSCVQILNTHGVRPGTLLWQRGVQIGVTLINRFLAKRDAKGDTCFKIDAANCPHLHAAFSGGYAYGKPGDTGYNGDNPEPMKGTSNQSFDYSHVCFVAGTLITTKRGQVPIESVTTDDEVLTRIGLCKVAGTMNRTATVWTFRFTGLSGDIELTGTPDHPVWSESRNEMVMLANLTTTDELRLFDNKIVRLNRTTGLRQARVYNLTVEGAHEYFANGILVSNCDAFRYPALNTLKLLKTEYQATKDPLFRQRLITNPNPDREI